MEGKGSEFFEKNKKLGLENRIRIGYNIIRGSREAIKNE
jgi:DNA topoisomerase VI subunit B